MESFNVIDGINVPSFETASRRHDIKNKFQLRPDDVFLVTYPKQGTTWTQNILRYFLMPESVDGDKDLDSLIPWIDLPFPSMEAIEAMPSPRIIKTHCPAAWLDDLLKGSKTNKIVFCYRNPKDSAVSLYKFLQIAPKHTGKPGIPEGTSFQDYFTEVFNKPGVAAYGGWAKHLEDWLALMEQRKMLVLKFEEMKEDPEREIRRVGDFLGVPYDDAMIRKIALATSFNAMKKDPQCNKAALFGAQFMRSGKVGGWEGFLSEEQVRELDHRAREIEEKHGLYVHQRT